MALIQYTALVSGMQGSINGSVLSKGRAGKVIYSKPVQRKEPSSAQSSRRTIFSAIAGFWRQLTEVQQNQWNDLALLRPVPNRFGDESFLSGYALFQRSLLFRAPLISPSTILASFAANQVYNVDPISLAAEIELTDEGYLITEFSGSYEFLNTSAVENILNVYISLPVPNPDFPYFKTWYLIFQSDVPPGLPVNIPINVTFNNLLAPLGFRSFPNAWHQVKIVYSIPQEARFSPDIIFPIQATFQPVVNYPVVNPYNGPATSIRPRRNTGTGFIIGNLAWTYGTLSQNYAAIYNVLLKVAPYQIGTGMPDPVSYSTENEFTLSWDAANSRQQLSGGSPLVGMFNWLSSAYGSIPIDIEGWYIPIEFRFKNKTTGVLSPVQYLFWQLAPYP